MKTLRKLFICLVLSAIVLGLPGVASAQGRWWQSERFKKELALTQEQITRIEGIYQSTLPLLRAQKEAFDRREEKLSKVIADPKSDEAMVVQASDRLEAARNEMGRTRTLMFFRIRRVLSDEQLLKLNVMHEHDRKERERRERERKGKGQNDGADCQ
jgi:Spy/CpxP family protein refolding chaperone